MAHRETKVFSGKSLKHEIAVIGLISKLLDFDVLSVTEDHLRKLVSQCESLEEQNSRRIFSKN